MSILDEIAAMTALRYREIKKKVPLDEVRKKALSLTVDKSFPFEASLRGTDISFICEVKRASPSKGVIAQSFPYLEVAQDYERAGASAISCLTEPNYFLGRDEYLREITENVKVPVLRKDFTIDEYQIYESKLLGASAVLLICALLDTEIIRSYIEICDTLGLSALVEAHDEDEIHSAIEAGARIIGVNNRNLKDFTVDVNNSACYRGLIPEGIIFVSESGITSAADIDLLRKNNVDAVLIGETLMRAPDKCAAMKELRGY